MIPTAGFHKTIPTPNGDVLVEGPLSPQALETFTLDEGLRAFRPPERQHTALVSIAAMPHGRVTVARTGNLVVGYVAFHPPDEMERWSKGNRGDVVEFGIEISPAWRRFGLARAVLEVSFMDDAMEDYIVISTEYYWHWDLRGTNLSPYQYRMVLAKIFGSVGLEPRGTDEPDIASHPANMLMVRFGRRVSTERAVEFESLRYEGRGLLY